MIAVALPAQQRRVQNNPYSDMRLIHFGFWVGTHTQDFSFTQSGNVTPNGEEWYSEVPTFSPGFCVGLTADLYLLSYLNLRFTPGIYFGNKTVMFREYVSGLTHTQDEKSNYLQFPFSLKYSSKRINNYRPYVSTGVNMGIDVSKRRSDFLRFKPFSTYLEFAMGCDIYLPYFKLIPELKFSIGLNDILQKKRPDLKDPQDIKYTQSLQSVYSRLVTLSFYFE